MTPTAPTPEQIAVIRQKFNEASVKSYPGIFGQIDPAKNSAAIFELEAQEGVLNLVNNLSQADRETRADKLIADGFAGLMLFELCWRGSDHYEVFGQWSSDAITWYPPRFLNGKLQPNLGESGQYALPNAYSPSPALGLLGPYPTSLPEGWVKIPPMADLLLPGADVDAILKAWF